MLQCIPTSGKSDEMEETMVRGYSRSTNLCAIFTSPGCPKVIKHAIPFFNKLVNVQTCGTLTMDTLSFQTSDGNIEMWDTELEEGNSALEQDTTELEINKPLDIGWITKTPQPLQDSDLQQALKIYLGTSDLEVLEYRPFTNLSINNLNYSTFKKHHSNSSIMISSPFSLIAACIFHIFQIHNSKNEIHTLLAICRHMEFRSEDPFQSYPALQMKFWLPGLMGQLDVVHPNVVLHHFASLLMTMNLTKVVAIISLSRVSFLF